MAVPTNTLQKNTLIARSVVKGFRNNLLAAKNSSKSMTETFKLKGYKAGDTITIKYAIRLKSALGAPISKNDVTESTTTLTLNQRNLGLGFLTKDLTLTIDNVGQYTEEATAQLMSDIDQDAFALYYKSTNLATPGAYVANGVNFMPAEWTGAAVGSAGLTPFLEAGARMSEHGVVVMNRIAAVTPGAQPSIITALGAYMQDSSEISHQYTTGMMREAAGYRWYMSQSMPRHTNGTRTKTGALINGATQSGTSLVLDTAGNALTIQRGDQFVIAGVNSINYHTRQATNKLQIFTVQAAATSSAGGDVTVTILPSISVTAPNETVSALPADNAVITWMGAASASTEVNFVWQKDALVSAWLGLDDDLPGADAAVATDPDTGITVRVAKYWVGDTDEKTTRLDVLYGFQIVRPEATSRVQG